MLHCSRITVQNGSPKSMIVNVEPECVHVVLSAGEEVVVQDAFDKEPMTLRIDADSGETVVSIWPGDGEVEVRKNGMDVRSLAQAGNVAR